MSKEITKSLREWANAYQEFSKVMEEFLNTYKRTGVIPISLKEESEKIDKFLNDFNYYKLLISKDIMPNKRYDKHCE